MNDAECSCGNRSYRKKSIYLEILAALLVTVLGCCGKAEVQESRRVLNIGMILGSGGLGDRSFNDSGYAGLQEAQKLYGIRFETINFSSEETNLEELQRLIRQGYDLIIGIGYENAGYIETLAKEYPDHKFALVDTVVEGDNIASITFREQEGDFLMGVLAAMLTKSGKIGFIGGVDIPPVQRIEAGFTQGALYQKKDIKIVTDIAGTFADPEIGKSLAIAQYESGVDIIYNGAGRTGLGIIEAAKDMNKLTIGTSGDQRYLAPGNVVGNRPKRVDTAILRLIEDLANEKFTPGECSLGLKEHGLSLGPFDENLVSQDMLKQLDTLKDRIISGEIQIQVP